MLNGTTLALTADGRIELDPFMYGQLVRVDADGNPQVCRDGETPFGVVILSGRQPDVTIIGIESHGRCKIGAGGPVGIGDRVTSDHDGYLRVSAGADAFAVATERGDADQYIVVRFIVTPADEIADDE